MTASDVHDFLGVGRAWIRTPTDTTPLTMPTDHSTDDDPTRGHDHSSVITIGPPDLPLRPLKLTAIPVADGLEIVRAPLCKQSEPLVALGDRLAE